MRISRRKFSQFAISGAAALTFGLQEPAYSSTKKGFDFGPNRLDWYPARTNDSKAPVIIYVHGGAWALGNRGQVGSKPRYFTRRGYHFVSVSYTLFPAANVETQALQIATAINWVHANATRLNADPNRIALMGHSAGCHLSSLATLTGGAPPVKAIVCNDTRAYDLKYLASISGGRLPLLYASPFRRRKMWPAWSPISYTGLQKQPPVLVAWSNGRNRDKISKRFADALEFDGVEVHRYDGSNQYNHVTIDRAMGSENGRLTQSVDRFFENVLSRSA
ncbi:MAG: alpha/beta hydrolase [Pseudomonadota bacterium]